MLDKTTAEFVVAHENEETSKLLLSAARYPDVDMKRAAAAIEARRKVKHKIPLWYGHPAISYPSSLAVEQCSSQATALYKADIAASGEHLTLLDMTGGLGVDSSFFAGKFDQVTYIERSNLLAEAAKGNFAVLGLENIKVVCRDSRDFLKSAGEFDVIYADPARRSKTSSRIYSIADCEPDIISLKEEIFKHSPRMIVKISPMADITMTLRQIPETAAVHIVSVGNECKELLLDCRKDFKGEAEIICTECNGFTFRFRVCDEKNSPCEFSESLGEYLFQPAKAILKAGAFKLAGSRYGLRKLAPTTHLYTGNTPVEDFPGKTFRIIDTIPFNSAAVRTLKDKYPQAELTAVNFPTDTDSLRRKLKIKDGGRIHIFATVSGSEKLLAVCRSVLSFS